MFNLFFCKYSAYFLLHLNLIFFILDFFKSLEYFKKVEKFENLLSNSNFVNYTDNYGFVLLKLNNPILEIAPISNLHDCVLFFLLLNLGYPVCRSKKFLYALSISISACLSTLVFCSLNQI